MGKTLRIEVKFKNARLFNAIQERSAQISQAPQAEVLHKAGPIKAFCILHDINLQFCYELLNLKTSPWIAGDPERGLRRVAQQLCDACEADPEWLFPRSLYDQSWEPLWTETDPSLFMPLTHEHRLLVDGAPSPEERIAQMELQPIMAQTLQTLTPREELVIRARYGIGSDEISPGSAPCGSTLNEIATELHLSKERVRQIEAKALRKLRHIRRSRPLRAFLD